MTFWNFVDIVVQRVRSHVDLPGNWPFGVFGRDDTEALIQYGSANVVLSTDGRTVQMIARSQTEGDVITTANLTSKDANEVGDTIGAWLASMPHP